MIRGILVCSAASAPARPAAPRCTPTGVDRPDLRFVDSNCDGIDGDARTAVFVAPNGKNGAPGTPAQPLRTISAAPVVANASAAKKDELSVYGVRPVRSTAIILDHVTITTGAGRPGARGSNPGGEGVSGRADESDRPGASARAVLEEVQP